MRYVSMGRVPAKRHTQVREDGALLVEEVMGYEGFSGNESILLHLQSPCRVAEVGEFTPIEHEEWVPDAHVHRLTNTAPLPPGGDPVFGRHVLMWNGDVAGGGQVVEDRLVAREALVAHDLLDQQRPVLPELRVPLRRQLAHRDVAHQRFPLAACSRSIASNSALKLPSPKPRAPCRSISSKKIVGRSPMGFVKTWSR